MTTQVPLYAATTLLEKLFLLVSVALHVRVLALSGYLFFPVALLVLLCAI